jgi:hypothetical protein
MRLFGLLVLIIGLAFATMLILELWGIDVISWLNLGRSVVTLIILGGVAIFSFIIYGMFFWNGQREPKVGDRSHHKKNLM